MSFDRQAARRAFNAYVSAYDPADVKISLKIAHTYRVAALCDAISASLPLSEEKRDFAWVSGLLHDVGRFEQLRRFHTFQDAVSVNHAALSADILFKDGKIADYDVPESWYPLLEKVIRLHNVYKLPENLTEKEHTFAAILRDADKVDIFRVNCETPLSDIYNCPESEFRTSAISDGVLADCLAFRTVDSAHRRTAADELVSHIALVFGLEYSESLRQALQQGYLQQMLAFESENSQTQERFAQIREAVDAYIRNRRS